MCRNVPRMLISRLETETTPRNANRKPVSAERPPMIGGPEKKPIFCANDIRVTAMACSSSGKALSEAIDRGVILARPAPVMATEMRKGVGRFIRRPTVNDVAASKPPPMIIGRVPNIEEAFVPASLATVMPAAHASAAVLAVSKLVRKL